MVIKSLSQIKNPSSDWFTSEFFQISKEDPLSILFRLFQKVKEIEIHPLAVSLRQTLP